MKCNFCKTEIIGTPVDRWLIKPYEKPKLYHFCTDHCAKERRLKIAAKERKAKA